MKIKPKLVPLENNGVYYVGDGKYIVCKFKWPKEFYTESFRGYSFQSKLTLGRWLKCVDFEYGDASYLMKNNLDEIKQNLENLKVFEEKRAMLEELGIITPPDKIL